MIRAGIQVISQTIAKKLPRRGKRAAKTVVETLPMTRSVPLRPVRRVVATAEEISQMIERKPLKRDGKVVRIATAARIPKKRV